MDGLWSLFEWTKKYQDFQSEFYNRPRTEAHIEDARLFVETYLNALNELNPKLEGQRAARLFVVQIRTEVDKFRQQFPVLEVFSCARFDERHWQKMSEIVGFELGQCKDSKISQICDLGLNNFVTKLKPIAFAAEREGKIADETQEIDSYWKEVGNIFQMGTSFRLLPSTQCTGKR